MRIHLQQWLKDRHASLNTKADNSISKRLVVTHSTQSLDLKGQKANLYLRRRRQQKDVSEKNIPTILSFTAAFKFESSRRLYQKACGFHREKTTHVTKAITSEQTELRDTQKEKESSAHRHLEAAVKCSRSHRQ